jgi:hypothetical protein
MIVDGNAHPFAGVDDLARDGDVLFAGRGISAGVVVDK